MSDFEISLNSLLTSKKLTDFLNSKGINIKGVKGILYDNNNQPCGVITQNKVKMFSDKELKIINKNEL